MMVMIAVMARPGVEAGAKQREHGVVPAEGQADPRGFGHAREIDLAHCGRGGVTYHHTNKDGG